MSAHLDYFTARVYTPGTFLLFDMIFVENWPFLKTGNGFFRKKWHNLRASGIIILKEICAKKVK